MSVKDTYTSNSNWLKAEDLKGMKVPLKIIEVNQEDPFKKGVLQIALTFEGKGKKLLLNKINANSIAESNGDDENTWVGKIIKVYPTTTDYDGKMVDCIRVEVEKPEAVGGDVPF